MPHHPGPLLVWSENGTRRCARWLSADDRPPPRAVHVSGDGLTASRALAVAADRDGVLWRGDYHQARQLLDAMRRRARRRRARRVLPVAEEFHRDRQDRARIARALGTLLVELHPPGELHLRRAPETAAAVAEVYGEIVEPGLVALRELLGVLNVHRQRHRGIPVAALGGARIHPHYGVFAPTRQDYVDLVADAPLPATVGHGTGTAFDLGTGTGVIAALLIARGLSSVTATDISGRAIACARDNLGRLGLLDVVELHHRDLFPPGRADLVVANPPWLPGTPAGPAEIGVYDPHGAMTSRFLLGLTGHLTPGGEGWLLRSTLPEHLGLRRPDHIPTLVDRAGLQVVDVHERAPTTRVRPDGPGTGGHRRHERIQLWRLTAVRTPRADGVTPRSAPRCDGGSCSATPGTPA